MEGWQDGEEKAVCKKGGIIKPLVYRELIMLTDMLLWLAVLALLVIGLHGFLFERDSKLGRRLHRIFWRVREVEPKRSSDPPSPAYSQLLSLCLGSHDKAERLIAYELRRTPSLTREKAILAAVDRLQYERS